MSRMIWTLLRTLISTLNTHRLLALENLALRQQILDRVLLVSGDPTGQDEKQELPGLEHEVHG